MNPQNKKAPEVPNASRHTMHAAIQQKNEARPVAPPVYKPQPQSGITPAKSGVVQTKLAAPVQGVRHPVAPPVYKPQAPLAPTRPGVVQRLEVQQTIQLSKRGAKGGKSGLTYTSIGGSYSQAQVGKAMKKAGVKGVKGHRKGNKNSGVSGQTKEETKKVVKALREIREEERTKKQGCRSFHRRRNVGQLCIHCGQYVR